MSVHGSMVHRFTVQRWFAVYGLRNKVYGQGQMILVQL